MNSDSNNSILVDLLAHAVRSKGLVIGFSPWRHLQGIGKFPFQMHLVCPGVIPELGLHTEFAVTPWYSSHFDEFAELSYRGDNVCSIRRQARADRKQRGSDQPRDFILADWEDAIARNPDLQSALLPPTAFIPIDVVGMNGHIRRGSRPLIGHYIRRSLDTIRPHIVVPVSNRASRELADKIATADILLLDLQELRGTKILEAIRLIITLRETTLPTLVILNTPSTLLTLGREILLDACAVQIAGPCPEPAHVIVSIVNSERIQEERQFQYLIGELKGRDPVLDRVIAAATSAWWVLNQSIGQCDSNEPALRRFERALEILASI
ncbi:MAG: hypothetical protein MN733_13055, partial [Nitrososphaera sp.]|nr:hypothetical protein [Nitrososphaera sp.]